MIESTTAEPIDAAGTPDAAAVPAAGQQPSPAPRQAPAPGLGPDDGASAPATEPAAAVEDRPPPPPEDATFQALLNEMGGDPDTTMLREIARTAVPLPGRIAEAWREWQAIMARRAGAGPLFPNPTLFRLYEQRAGLLEELALWSLPALSPGDGAARLHLLRARLEPPAVGTGSRLEPHHLMRILDALAGDLEALDAPDGSGPALGPAQGQGLRTATERRAAVIGHLCDPELSRWSDRAIARACGVSPQTVGNWRRKLSDDSGQDEAESSVRLFTRSGRTHEMQTRQIGGGAD